ncbi:MAG: 4-hydroxybenzoate octaprenyltransferase [Steroidobacteraceae bacterium]
MKNSRRGPVDPAYKPTWQPQPLRSAVVAFVATLHQYARLMRLDKPVGFWLLLWPTLWALWIAGKGRPDPRMLIVFLCGVVVTRSAGCVINDFADRDFDRQVRRTADRPLATGRVGRGEALVLFVALGLVAVALALALPPAARALAAIGAGLTVTYPLMKRFVHIPQLYLGAAFGWGVPMAFAALEGSVPRLGWLLFVAAVLWAVVYDTMYAMVDREDDRRAGIKSSAILFGEADRAVIAMVQAMILYALVLVAGKAGLGAWYFAGLAAGAVLFLHGQWLIRDRHPVGCFRAFNDAHYFGLCVFVGIALDYLYR